MSLSWRIAGADIARLDRIAAALALIVRPGDLIALEGDLGAGKTTFARAFIGRLRGGAMEEVPSPTFALVQTYATPRMAVTHIDGYRLGGARDVEELGLDEALADGLVLIEWPSRVADLLPADRFEIALDDQGEDDTRAVTLTGHGAAAPRLARLRSALDFIEASGWGRADPLYIQGDASVRRYARLQGADASAILMDAPRQPDGPPIRAGKPYSGLAHLAEDVRPFVALTNALRGLGLSAPAVIAHDMAQGFLLLEDLGDLLYTRAVAAGADMETLYRAAVDALLVLRKATPPVRLPLPDGTFHRLQAYDEGALGIEVELLLDWFWPALHGAPAPARARAEFLTLWGERFAALARQPQGLVLRDYHSPNLLWLPEREGVARVGVLDMQDALRGPVAYDLVALLQDARQAVPAALERDLFGYYSAASERADSSFDRSEFTAAYASLGAQRNTKILGIFARLARRDGKRAYLAHIPRVSAYLERNLAHSSLGGLKAWYDRHLPFAARARVG